MDPLSYSTSKRSSYQGDTISSFTTSSSLREGNWNGLSPQNRENQAHYSRARGSPSIYEREEPPESDSRPILSRKRLGSSMQANNYRAKRMKEQDESFAYLPSYAAEENSRRSTWMGPDIPNGEKWGSLEGRGFGQMAPQDISRQDSGQSIYFESRHGDGSAKLGRARGAEFRRGGNILEPSFRERAKSVAQNPSRNPPYQRNVVKAAPDSKRRHYASHVVDLTSPENGNRQRLAGLTSINSGSTSRKRATETEPTDWEINWDSDFQDYKSSRMQSYIPARVGDNYKREMPSSKHRAQSIISGAANGYQHQFGPSLARRDNRNGSIGQDSRRESYKIPRAYQSASTFKREDTCARKDPDRMLSRQTGQNGARFERQQSSQHMRAVRHYPELDDSDATDNSMWDGLLPNNTTAAGNTGVAGNIKAANNAKAAGNAKAVGKAELSGHVSKRIKLDGSRFGASGYSSWDMQTLLTREDALESSLSRIRLPDSTKDSKKTGPRETNNLLVGGNASQHASIKQTVAERATALENEIAERRRQAQAAETIVQREKRAIDGLFEESLPDEANQARIKLAKAVDKARKNSAEEAKLVQEHDKQLQVHLAAVRKRQAAEERGEINEEKRQRAAEKRQYDKKIEEDRLQARRKSAKETLRLKQLMDEEVRLEELKKLEDERQAAKKRAATLQSFKKPGSKIYSKDYTSHTKEPEATKGSGNISENFDDKVFGNCENTSGNISGSISGNLSDGGMFVPDDIPADVSDSIPGAVTGDIPGAVPDDVPGDGAGTGNFTGAVTDDVILDALPGVVLTGDVVPGEVSSDFPGDVPGKIPGDVPGDIIPFRGGPQENEAIVGTNEVVIGEKAAVPTLEAVTIDVIPADKPDTTMVEVQLKPLSFDKPTAVQEPERVVNTIDLTTTETSKLEWPKSVAIPTPDLSNKPNPAVTGMSISAMASDGRRRPQEISMPKFIRRTSLDPVRFTGGGRSIQDSRYAAHFVSANSSKASNISKKSKNKAVGREDSQLLQERRKGLKGADEIQARAHVDDERGNRLKRTDDIQPKAKVNDERRKSLKRSDEIQVDEQADNERHRIEWDTCMSQLKSILAGFDPRDTITGNQRPGYGKNYNIGSSAGRDHQSLPISNQNKRPSLTSQISFVSTVESLAKDKQKADAERLAKYEKDKVNRRRRYETEIRNVLSGQGVEQDNEKISKQVDEKMAGWDEKRRKKDSRESGVKDVLDTGSQQDDTLESSAGKDLLSPPTLQNTDDDRVKDPEAQRAQERAKAVRAGVEFLARQNKERSGFSAAASKFRIQDLESDESEEDPDDEPGMVAASTAQPTTEGPEEMIGVEPDKSLNPSALDLSIIPPIPKMTASKTALFPGIVNPVQEDMMHSYNVRHRAGREDEVYDSVILASFHCLEEANAFAQQKLSEFYLSPCTGKSETHTDDNLYLGQVTTNKDKAHDETVWVTREIVYIGDIANIKRGDVKAIIAPNVFNVIQVLQGDDGTHTGSVVSTTSIKALAVRKAGERFLELMKPSRPKIDSMTYYNNEVVPLVREKMEMAEAQDATLDLDGIISDTERTFSIFISENSVVGPLN